MKKFRWLLLALLFGCAMLVILFQTASNSSATPAQQAILTYTPVFQNGSVTLDENESYGYKPIVGTCKISGPQATVVTGADDWSATVTDPYCRWINYSGDCNTGTYTCDFTSGIYLDGVISTTLTHLPSDGKGYCERIEFDLTIDLGYDYGFSMYWGFSDLTAYSGENNHVYFGNMLDLGTYTPGTPAHVEIYQWIDDDNNWENGWIRGRIDNGSYDVYTGSYSIDIPADSFTIVGASSYTGSEDLPVGYRVQNFNFYQAYTDEYCQELGAPVATPTPPPPTATTPPIPTSTPEPPIDPPSVVDIFPCNTCDPCCDWNLRSQCGNNDLWVRIDSGSGDVTGYNIVVRDEVGTEMCRRTLRNDLPENYYLFVYLDEMITPEGKVCSSWPAKGMVTIEPPS